MSLGVEFIWVQLYGSSVIDYYKLKEGTTVEYSNPVGLKDGEVYPCTYSEDNLIGYRTHGLIRPELDNCIVILEES